MPETLIKQPDTKEFEESLVPFVAGCESLAISSKEEHQRGLELIKEITEKERTVKGLFSEPKSLANKAHKAITAAEKKLLAPLGLLKAHVVGKCVKYEQEQHRIAEEKRRALEEEARKAQEESRILDAALAEDAGEKDTAEAILEAPVAVPVMDVKPETGKAEGVSTTTRWTAEVTDKMALVRYVAENPEWEGLLEPNMPSLRGLARSQKANLKIPGVKARPEYGKTVRV